MAPLHCRRLRDHDLSYLLTLSQSEQESSMAISYEWTQDDQQDSVRNKFFKYIKDYVNPYHPYYRKLFKENKIDPDKLSTLDDLRRILITTKEDTLADQKSFIMQPKFESTEYDVEEIAVSYTH